MPVISQKSEKTTGELTEAKLSEAKMHDVLLLVENLLIREETNVRHIIDCLYDVGSNNLINAKVSSRSLRGISKLIVRLSKPAFKIVAWYWFKKNCPRLITDWLQTKVAFDTQAKPSLDNIIETETPFPENSLTDDNQIKIIVPDNNTQAITDSQNLIDKNRDSIVNDDLRINSLQHLQLQERQFQSLNFQVKVLTGALIGAIAVFGTGFIWLGYSIKFERAQMQNQLIEKANTRKKPISRVYSPEVESRLESKDK
ncbi:MAG: hypothetical protein AAF378_20870 [Cyanobacteria bacterium P01_A01_bin.84]